MAGGITVVHSGDDVTLIAERGVPAPYLLYKLAAHTDPHARLTGPVELRFLLGLAAAHETLTEEIAAHLDVNAGLRAVGIDQDRADEAERS